jgi:CheY-like chemotaxis protein
MDDSSSRDGDLTAAARAEVPGVSARPLVLVVDDHADTREMLRYAIEMNGYRVVEVADGEEAVRVATELGPNLVLMDTSLPDVDGYTATQRIRKVESLRNVKIIFLSGHAELPTRELAMAVGGDDYFVKPVNLGHLEQALAKHLKLPG